MLNSSFVNEGLYLLTHFPDSCLLLCYINVKLIKLFGKKTKHSFVSKVCVNNLCIKIRCP